MIGGLILVVLVLLVIVVFGCSSLFDDNGAVAVYRYTYNYLL